MTTSTSTAGSTRTSRSDGRALRVAAGGAPQQPPPSAELLEFLGEFTDERGEWVDPLDLGESEKTDDPGAGAKDEKKDGATDARPEDAKPEGGVR